MPGNIYDSTLMQVCAQGLLPRANGYRCTTGIVYYAASKRRVEVPLDDISVAKTLQAIYDMKAMVRDNIIPPPLSDSPKCPRCSLVGICLPDETNALHDADLDKTGPVRTDAVRRLYPMRLDSKPVYVHEQGVRLHIRQHAEGKVQGRPNAEHPPHRRIRPDHIRHHTGHHAGGAAAL